jgi:competence protein ComEC
VGDGDCIIIRSPEGQTMLVDAGTRQNPESGSDIGQHTVLPYLLTEKVGRLDCVVLTHPHDDHMSGLPTILRRFPVGQYVDSGERVHSTGYDAVLAVIRDRAIPYRIARRGQTLQLGREVRAHFLTPLEPRFRGSRSDLNNNSIAIKIVFRQFSALLGGDIEDEAETRLIALGGSLRATLLKACHHGSKTSNTEAFLRAVRPKVTIIPCGPSTFLHPAPETLDRLNAVRTRVYRTDLHGAVTVYSDGNRYWVETFRNGRERVTRFIRP